MVAERWYALLILVFLLGYLVGDTTRRTIEQERRRRQRRELRQVQRALRQQGER